MSDPVRVPLWDLSQQSRGHLLTALMPMLLSVVLIVSAFLPLRPPSTDNPKAGSYSELVNSLTAYAELTAQPGTAPQAVESQRAALQERLKPDVLYPNLAAREREAGVRLEQVAPLLTQGTPGAAREALDIALDLNNANSTYLLRRVQVMESTILLVGLISGLLGSTLILGALNRAGHERSARERSETQQREALGIAAHELRRPMQALLLATEALRHTDNLRAREKLLRSIEDAADQLASRSELEHLDARYVRMTSSPAPTDLTALVTRHESLRVRVRRPPGPLMWTVDGTQVQQIVENLVENAIKYSSGPITITLDPPTTTWGPTIRVTDHGPGLHPSLREQVFQSGTRLATHVPGRGLGLPLARRLAQVNRAEITLHDTPGGGLDVRVAFHLTD